MSWPVSPPSTRPARIRFPSGSPSSSTASPSVQPLYRESPAIVRDHLREARPTTLMVMNNLASVLDYGGEVDTAGEILRRKVALEAEPFLVEGQARLERAEGQLRLCLRRIA